VAFSGVLWPLVYSYSTVILQNHPISNLERPALFASPSYDVVFQYRCSLSVNCPFKLNLDHIFLILHADWTNSFPNSSYRLKSLMKNRFWIRVQKSKIHKLEKLFIKPCVKISVFETIEWTQSWKGTRFLNITEVGDWIPIRRPESIQIPWTCPNKALGISPCTRNSAVALRSSKLLITPLDKNILKTVLEVPENCPPDLLFTSLWIKRRKALDHFSTSRVYGQPSIKTNPKRLPRSALLAIQWATHFCSNLLHLMGLVWFFFN